MKTEEAKKELITGLVDKEQSSSEATKLANDEMGDLLNMRTPIQLQMSGQVQVQQEAPKTLCSACCDCIWGYLNTEASERNTYFGPV